MNARPNPGVWDSINLSVQVREPWLHHCSRGPELSTVLRLSLRMCRLDLTLMCMWCILALRLFVCVSCSYFRVLSDMFNYEWSTINGGGEGGEHPLEVRLLLMTSVHLCIYAPGKVIWGQFFIYKFSPNLLNGRVNEDRTRSKQSL